MTALAPQERPRPRRDRRQHEGASLRGVGGGCGSLPCIRTCPAAAAMAARAAGGPRGRLHRAPGAALSLGGECAESTRVVGKRRGGGPEAAPALMRVACGARHGTSLPASTWLGFMSAGWGTRYTVRRWRNRLARVFGSSASLAVTGSSDLGKWSFRHRGGSRVARERKEMQRP